MAEMPDCKVKLNFEGREELECSLDLAKLLLADIRARLRKAPVAELRRLASEDYCGERLFESGLVCGMPRGHAEPYHKASVDILAWVGIDLADAIDSVLGKFTASEAA